MRAFSVSLIFLGVVTMGLFGWFSGRKGSENQGEPQPDQMPWDRHPSIYEHLRSHIQSGKPGLTAGGEDLPDQDHSTNKIHWAPGAEDGVFSYHVGGHDAAEETENLLALIRAYCDSPTARNKKVIYDFLLSHSVLGLIDPLSDALRLGKTSISTASMNVPGRLRWNRRIEGRLSSESPFWGYSEIRMIETFS